MRKKNADIVGGSRIDIVKDKFDAVCLPTNEHVVFENNKEGIKHYIASP